MQVFLRAPLVNYSLWNVQWTGQRYSIILNPAQHLPWKLAVAGPAPVHDAALRAVHHHRRLPAARPTNKLEVFGGHLLSEDDHSYLKKLFLW